MLFALVLVMNHPWGSSGITSQTIDGFKSETACTAALTKAREHKFVVGAFCLPKDYK